MSILKSLFGKKRKKAPLGGLFLHPPRRKRAVSRKVAAPKHKSIPKLKTPKRAPDYFDRFGAPHWYINKRKR